MDIISNLDYIFQDEAIPPTKVVSLDIESHTFVFGNMCPFPTAIIINYVDESLHEFFEKIPKSDYIFRNRSDQGYVTIFQFNVKNYVHIKDFLDFILANGNAVTGANIGFDFMLLMNYILEATDTIFNLYADNRVTDLRLREWLISLALGRFHYDPRVKMKRPAYSLAMLSQIHLDEKMVSKEKISKDPKHLFQRPKSWRVGYALLQDRPITRWPQDALDYILKDAYVSRDVYFKQTAMRSRFTNSGDLIYQDNHVIDEYRQARGAFALTMLCNEGMIRDREKAVEFVIKTVREMQRVKPLEELLGIKRVANKLVSWDSIKSYLKEINISFTDPNLEKYWETVIVPELNKLKREDKSFTHKAKDGKGQAVILRAIVNKLCQYFEIIPSLTDGGYKLLHQRAFTADNVPSKYISADGDSLERLVADPIINFYSKFLSYKTLFTNFVPRLLGPEDVITASVDPTLETGRASIYDPGFQQLPREGGFREIWIDDSTHWNRIARHLAKFWGLEVPTDIRGVLNSTDYSFIEMGTLAEVNRCAYGVSVMGDIINEGKDPHLYLATELLKYDSHQKAPEGGWSYELVAAIYKDTMHFLYGDVANARQFAKIGNFGIAGGLTEKSFVEYALGYGIVLTLADAKKIIEVYKRAYPEMAMYFKSISEICGYNKPGDIQQLKSNRVRGQITYTQACNTNFQGLAADGLKAALFEIFRHTKVFHENAREVYGIKTRCAIHDETITGGPLFNTRWAMIIANIQVACMQVFTPSVKTAAEGCLMASWSKSAKTKYDTNGMLVLA